MTNQIFTIGHSNHTWETFSPLLLANEIELLVDVRSNPVSRFAPFANHRTLPGLLESIGVDYEFMGGTLGGKPADKSMYDLRGKPDYRRMRASDVFQDAIQQLAGMASRRQTVILCSEEDPSQCHRLLLMGMPLEELGCSLRHVRGDGQVQTTEQLPKGTRYKKERQYPLLIDGEQSGPKDTNIYTIGFTGKTAEEFFDLLNSTDAKYLVDTRLNNTTQLAGFTKRRDLSYFTEQLTDMSYMEMPILAPEKEMFTEYRKGGDWEHYESLYIRLLGERGVTDSIDHKIFESGVVLLCSERTPEKCHRRLAAEYLQSNAFFTGGVIHLE